MSILFFILKIIGILILIPIVLLLILLIFPICYQMEGDFDDKTPKAQAKVSWAVVFLRAKVFYEEELNFAIRIFGIPVYDSRKDHWSVLGEHPEKDKKKNKKKHKKKSISEKKSKKEAKQALKAHYEGKPLLPKVFKDENHLEEIRAVYVPFWLFDLDTAGRFSYEATKTRVWEDDDYNYTATRFYHVARAGKINFRKIPVDGSKAIDDTMMEAIEPYEYQDLTEFNMSYLSGYMADKYDQEPDELTGRVYERMEQSVKDCFEASVKGYATVTPKQEKVTVTNKGEVKYGLFPVWFLNTKWNGKTYSFAMNGQTGRLIGDLPVGKDLAVKYWFKCHIPLTIAMTAIVTALRFMGVI